MAANTRRYSAGPWKVEVTKNHILSSKCEKDFEEGCPIDDSENKCIVCRFNQDLKLPSLPEMVFPESSLKIEHASGVTLEFLAMDALQLVNTSEYPLKVAMADEWSKQRTESLQKVKDTVKPFDWTYTTDYKGTLSSRGAASFEVTETDEKIDYERLKMQEKITFYDEVILFEDELADNGAAILSVKIRLMASGFFILQRFFLRVDGVLIRLIDTRYYHRVGTDYLLREYTRKDSSISELMVPTSFLTEPNKLSNFLPVRELVTHKLSVPKST